MPSKRLRDLLPASTKNNLRKLHIRKVNTEFDHNSNALSLVHNMSQGPVTRRDTTSLTFKTRKRDTENCVMLSFVVQNRNDFYSL